MPVPANITNGNSIFAYRGKQLIVHDGGGVYARDDVTDRFVSKSAHAGPDGTFSLGAPAIEVKQKPLTRSVGYQLFPDLVVHSSGYECVAWENSSSGIQGESSLPDGVYFSLIDSSNRNNIVSNVPAASSTTNHSPKLLALGQWILILYVDGQSLMAVPIDTTNVAAGTGTPITLHSNFPTDSLSHNYDACVIGSVCYFAVADASGSVLVKTLNSSLGVASGATFTGPATGCITIFPDSNGTNVIVAWCDTVSVKFRVYTSGLSAVAGPNTAGAAAATSVTGSSHPGSTSVFQLFWTVPASGVNNPYLLYKVQSNILTNYSSSSNGEFSYARGVGLSGKAFTTGNIVYVLVAYGGQEQPTNFLLDQTGRVVAKALWTTSGASFVRDVSSNPNGTTVLPECNIVGAEVSYGMQELVSLRSGGTTLIGFKFMSGPIQSAEIGDTLHFGGGILWMYDGSAVVEHGFHIWPEKLVVQNPGGSVVYQYAAIYSWTDNNGRVHRSAPSVPVTQAMSVPINGTASSVNVVIPTLRLTAKTFAPQDPVVKSPVTIEVYRTLDAGVIFYRLPLPTSQGPLNDPSADTVTFVDTIPDFLLQSQEQLYTTGNVLENHPAPASAGMVQSQNRIWLIDATDPNKLWYSQEVIPGSPAEFNADLIQNIEPQGGPATALAVLDDKTVVFRENAITYIAGVGPDRAGGQNDFREIPLPSEAGCVDPGSIAVGGVGIIFKSNKGFFLLDRSLETRYVGAPVESFNGSQVTSAKVLPKTNWIIFTLDSGDSLLYDYQYDQWSEFPGVSAADSTIWNNKHTRLRSDGVVLVETPGVFDDDGSYIPLGLTLPWIQVAGLQGFKRVWSVYVIGEWFSGHRLQVDLKYDFNDDVIEQSDTFIASTQMKPLQWRVETKKQLCEAIQVTLTEIPDSDVVGEGLSISAISLECGVRRGLFKLPASQRKG